MKTIRLHFVSSIYTVYKHCSQVNKSCFPWRVQVSEYKTIQKQPIYSCFPYICYSFCFVSFFFFPVTQFSRTLVYLFIYLFIYYANCPLFPPFECELYRVGHLRSRSQQILNKFCWIIFNWTEHPLLNTNVMSTGDGTTKKCLMWWLLCQLA